MKNTIYEYSHYRPFLSDYIAAQPNKGWGMQAKFAKHLNVHTTFISQVLNDQFDLSLEQGILICEFIGLSQNESDFFMLLLNHDRAGNTKLKSHFKKQINAVIQSQYKVKDIVQSTRTMSPEELTEYYSSWHYNAVDFAATLKHIKTSDDIANYLNLPKHRVNQILDFLTSVGVMTRENGRFKSGNTRVFIPFENWRDSSRHSMNWRLKALEYWQKIDGQNRTQKFTWTSVVTLAKKDVIKLREEMLKCVEKISSAVKDSQDEEVIYAYAMDLFPVCADETDAPQIEDLKSET